MLKNGERSQLLELARRSIDCGLGGIRPEPAPEEAWSPRLLEPQATFVTLTLDGELRGCCGTIEPERPLVYDVWQNAWVSAYADPRFYPLPATELGSLEIAISALTPLEPIVAASESELIASLEPGLDGLVLCYGAARATFLPVVWQSLPEPHEFVAQLKRKIGWPSLALSSQMMAFRYRTETFGASHGVALAA
jgi:uncharacterized protein